MAKLIVSCMILLFGLTQIKSIMSESCPELEPMLFQDLPQVKNAQIFNDFKNFANWFIDQLQVLGVWYDGPYYPSEDFPEGISCGRTTFELLGEICLSLK
jgi:hypothetical protein